MKVPFFKYSGLVSKNQQGYADAYDSATRRGAFILQSDVRQCEDKVSQLSGLSNVVGVANATDGLEIITSLVLENFPKGKASAVVCGHTMSATCSAAVSNGLKCIAVDAAQDLMMCPEALADELTRNDDIAVVYLTQLNGFCSENSEQIRKICAERGVVLLEDSAQALGASYEGKPAGSYGVAGVLSFYPAKVFGAFGDAGAVVTNDEKLAHLVRVVSNHGKDDYGKCIRLGRNSRLDNLQAAFLNITFEQFEDIIAHRQSLARIYDRGLQRLPVKLPYLGRTDGTYQNYEIFAPDAGRLRKFLTDSGVGVLHQWNGQHAGSLPFVEDRTTQNFNNLYEGLVCLPCSFEHSTEEIEFVVNKITEFYG